MRSRYDRLVPRRTALQAVSFFRQNIVSAEARCQVNRGINATGCEKSNEFLRFIPFFKAFWCLFFLEWLNSLLDKDKDILGHCYGVFGYKKKKLEFIALEERMKVDGVIKARKAAIERLQKKYPESKLYLWRKIYWTVMDEAMKGPM